MPGSTSTGVPTAAPALGRTTSVLPVELLSSGGRSASAVTLMVELTALLA